MNKLRFPSWKHGKLAANIALFMLLFAISVGVRLDNMSYPIGRGHEWITGHVLITETVYQESGGPSKFYFSPVWTFDRAPEKFLMESLTFKDKNNFSYYVSYPPLCFLLPYYCFMIFGIKADTMAIRYFGILIHLACAFLVMLIIMEMFGRKLREHIFWPAIAGASIYMFSAGNLWYHSNIYFADTLVPLFILSTFLLLVKVLREKEKARNPKFIILFGLFNFLGVYTEWLQVFFAFSICVLFFFLTFRYKAYFRLALIVAVTTLLGVGLTIWQYSSIAGFDNLQKQSVEKYKQRSGRAEAADSKLAFLSSESFLVLTGNYEKQYKHALDLTYFCLLVILVVFISRYNKIEFLRARSHIYLPVLLLGISILIHILLFYNFNCGHDFSTLKTSMLMAIIVGIGFAAILNETERYSRFFRITSLVVSFGFLAYTISGSINRYYKNNNSNQVTNFHVNIGTVARIYAAPDELVFAPTVNPVTSYCAGRNVQNAESIQQAFNFLRTAKYPKGIYISAEENERGMIKKVVRLNSNGDTVLVLKDYIPPRIDP